MHQKNGCPEEKNCSQTRILIGMEVLDILKDRSFLRSWIELYEDCPWSTIFQSPQFVVEWYEAFFQDFEPIMIFSNSLGTLSAVIFLSKGRGFRDEITGVGKGDGLYQTWLARENDYGVFLKNVIKLLRSKFNKSKLVLSCIPNGAPIAWMENDPSLDGYGELVPINRPHVELKEGVVRKLTKKKQFREDRNRLKRIGDLTFEQISGKDKINSVLEDLVVQYDFRQGAIHNRTPFRDNPQKKAFYTRLFEKGLMFLYVLKLDGKIISSISGTYGKGGWSHGAGINTQSIQYSRHSPGFLIFIMLINDLYEKQGGILDLTIGGQAYKDRLANTSDTVYKLTVYPQKKNPLSSRIKSLLNKWGNAFIANVYKNPKVAKSKLRHKWGLRKEQISLIKRFGLSSWVKHPFLPTEVINDKYFILDKESNLPQEDPSTEINYNSLKDLLNFEPDGVLLTRQQFLFDCLKKLQQGDIPITWTIKGGLIGSVWLKSKFKDKKRPNESKISEDSPVLHGLYLHKKYQDKLPTFLVKVKQKVAELTDKENLCLSANEKIKSKHTGLKELV
ncbi:GNAT family N-acetyltransferase [Echinicola salinicaeni]|uniref:GNAT family N-acetyltransferase n=1 Tax=Echinicola salinicaeni TaxID=2762757 RepID=UPI001643FF3D|nr:GNAT family N-acetyltransferase [Echinicola salinicaeni]